MAWDIGKHPLVPQLLRESVKGDKAIEYWWIAQSVHKNITKLLFNNNKKLYGWWRICLSTRLCYWYWFWMAIYHPRLLWFLTSCQHIENCFPVYLEATFARAINASQGNSSKLKYCIFHWIWNIHISDKDNVCRKQYTATL